MPALNRANCGLLNHTFRDFKKIIMLRPGKVVAGEPQAATVISITAAASPNAENCGRNEKRA